MSIFSLQQDRGEITVSATLPVPANIVNPANISFVAFLTKASDNIAINARAAHANESQSFQENP